MRVRKLTGVVAILLIALLAFGGSAMAGNGPKNFRAHLNGSNEVPPVDTQAQGQVNFKFSKDGTDLHYKLIVANIDDVFAAHIHCGIAGQNGPIGLTLFAGGPVSVNGILAEATVQGPNPGNACFWTTLADIAAAMSSGGAYVNVHTTDHGSGEIRGQVR